MLALGLCIALFVYWTVIGYATVALLHAGRTPLRNLLIAPTVGVIVGVLPLFTLNRLGVPVMKCGAATAAVLLLAAAAVLMWLWRKDRERVMLPWGKAAAFAGVAVLALYLTGRPMAEFGFDWVSYSNEDMANYCLAADRNYRQGFFDFPPSEHLLQGKYYASDYFFLYVAEGVRPASELTLAGVMSLSRRNAHEVFMPTIVAFHLALVWAGGAFLLRLGPPWGRLRDRGARTDGAPEAASPPLETALSAPLASGDDGFLPAVITCVMLAACSLLNLSALYQLIAQTIGLAVLTVMAGLLLRPFDGVSMRRLVLHGVLIAIVGAGLLAFYPEVGPFIGLPFFLYVGLGLARRRLGVVPPLVLVGVGAAGALVLLRKYAVMVPVFFRLQVQHAAGENLRLDPRDAVFPYFMLPKGLSDLWGVLPIAGWTTEPGLSVAIAAGGLVLLAAALAALWGTWRGRPEATVALVMLATGAVLFHQRVGFGLFKLAMYLQPFVLATLAAAAFALARRWRVRADLALTVAALVVAAYLMVTHGRGALPEVPMGEQPRKTLLSEFPWAGLAVSALPLLLAAGVCFALGWARKRSGESGGRALRLPWGLAAAAPLVALAYVGLTGQQLYLRASRGKAPQFAEVPQASAARINDEFQSIVSSSPHPLILSDTYNIALAKFQALYTGGRVLSFPSGRFFLQIEARHASQPVFLAEVDPVRVRELRTALWSQMPEKLFDLKDPSQPDMRNVFRVCDMGLLVAPGMREQIERSTREDSAPLAADPDHTLYVQAVGRQSILNRHHYPSAGRTSNYEAATLSDVANRLVFVQSKLGRPYFQPASSGSRPALYQVESEPPDTPFGRDGSFAATGQYLLFQAVNPSPKVRLVLSYTCSYNDDGQALLPRAHVIGAERVPFRVVGRGAARLFSEPVEAQQIAGRQFLMLDLGTPGKRLPVRRTGLMNWFGTDVGIDTRDVVGRARDVSIVSEEQYQALKPPSRLIGFDSRGDDHPLRNRQLEYCGWYENDGWVSEEAYCHLTQPPGPQVVVVRGIVPGLTPAFHTSVSLLLDGAEVARTEVVPEVDGRFQLVAPVATEPGKHEVRVRFSNYQRLPEPDNRPAGARIISIGFEPAGGGSSRSPRSRPASRPVSAPASP